MFSLLKKIIGVIIFVFGCFDCVKSIIIGFVVMLTTNHFFTLLVVTSQFMLLYTLFHCIPFRSFVLRVLGGDPWQHFPKSHPDPQQDQDTCYSSCSESDTVVYDPENLHWSSSSLSTHLDEVNQDGGQIPKPATKPKRHTWVWTSDEDSQDESYDDGISGNDAGYMIETTTESDSSCDETLDRVRNKHLLPKSSTEMISMDVEIMERGIDSKDECQVEAEVGLNEVGKEVTSCFSAVQEVSENDVKGSATSDDIMVENMAPNTDTVSTNSTDDDDLPSLLQNDKNKFFLHSDSLKVFDRVVVCEDVDGFQETQMTSDGDCCRDKVDNISESSVDITSNTDGILQSKAVKLGLVAAGFGIGAYIVYKLCFKK